MHKKAGVDGRGVVLAGRVHECCGGSQQLGWVDLPPQNTAKKIKRRKVQDSNLRRLMYSSTAA